MPPLDLFDIPPFDEGMNTQVSPWAIQDNQARYLQDTLHNKPKMVYRRGPVKPGKNSSGNDFTTFSDAGIGIVATEDPNDVWRVGVLHGTASTAKLARLSTTYTTHTDTSWGESAGVVFNPALRHQVATSQHPWGGVLIGTQVGYNQQATIGHWYGASAADYSTGTITVAQDSVTVTGSGTTWTGNVEAGQFLFARAEVHIGTSSSNRTFIGIVKSVDSNTQITLTQGALLAVTGRSYRIKSIRPVDRRVAKGLITTTKQTKLVQGHNTKFERQGLETASAPHGGTGAWCLFRADDMKYIGNVSSVQSDIQLTLTADAAVNCNKSKFVAIDLYYNASDLTDVEINTTKDPGWITAHFANRQWYANRPYSNKSQPYSPARVWFSDLFDPEALDLTSDGDHFIIPSDNPPIKPITGMAALNNVLLCFKEDETWGVFGTNETNFTVKKILDDGCFDPMAIQFWNEGVVWAGQKGIWFYDGTEAFNIVEDRIGGFYKDSVEAHKSKTYKAFSMLHRDTYFLYVENAAPPHGPIKGAGSPASVGVPTKYLALAIYLPNRAVSTLTNFSFRGSVKAPFEETLGTLYLVNKLNNTNPWALVGARICQAEDLFDESQVGLDTVFTHVISPADNALGPDLYIESKRFDMGAPQIKKVVKQLQMLYKLQSTDGSYITSGDTSVPPYTTDYLSFATVLSMNESATVSGAKWNLTRLLESGSGVAGFVNKKKKFSKRSTHLGFRIWQSNLTSIKDVRIGPMAFGYRRLRTGRT